MLKVVFYRSVGVAVVFALCLVASPGDVRENDLNIIPRWAWNALAPSHEAAGEHGMYNVENNPSGWRVYDEPLSDALKIIVIHHSGLLITDGPREIQRKHINERGFADIGYHFLVDEEGNVFQGRDINVRGAHVAAHNTGAVGIALLGNFEASSPTYKQIISTKALVRYLAQTYKISRIAGHRDFQTKPTVCPGKKLADQLPQIALECGLQLGVEHIGN